MFVVSLLHRIALHGYYGNENMGDDAILYVTKEIFKQIPNTELEVIGHPVPIMKTSFGRKIAKLPYGRTLLYKWHVRKMLKQLEKTDALILGGGGFFCDRKDRDVTNDVRLIRRMQSKGKPTIIYAVGALPIWREKTKKLIKEAVENANYTSVRDPMSAKKIVEYVGVDCKVHVTGDPAIKIPKILGIRVRIKKLDLENLNVCVSLREISGSNKAMTRTIVKFVNYLIKNYNANIKFIPMRTRWDKDDRVIHNFVKKDLNNNNIQFLDKRPSVGEFVEELGNTTLTIGVPLHSLVLSASIGVPCIAISYKPDITGFMEYIECENYEVFIKDLFYENCLIEKTEELLSSYATVSKKLLQKVAEIQKKTLSDEKAIKKIAGNIN